MIMKLRISVTNACILYVSSPDDYLSWLSTCSKLITVDYVLILSLDLTTAPDRLIPVPSLYRLDAAVLRDCIQA
jgi:hypothetical protein